MNKITKMLACVGLAAAAIGVAMPATAADTSANTSASGSRLEGGFQLGSGEYYFSLFGVQDPATTDPAFTSGGHNWATKHYTFPAAGTTGPVINTATGLCLTAPATAAESADVLAAACDGSARQDWTLAAGDINPAATVINYAADPTFGLGLGPEDTGAASVSVLELQTRLNGKEALNMTLLTPVAAVVVPVDITGPSAGEIVDTQTPKFEGTGDEGAEVIVTDASGQELCRTTVVNGVWDCTSTVTLPIGPVDVTATQTATDGTTTTDTTNFTISPVTPVIDPAIAGGAGIALAAIAGAAFALRRKNTAAATA